MTVRAVGSRWLSHTLRVARSPGTGLVNVRSACGIAPVVVVRVDAWVGCVGYAGAVGTVLAFTGRLSASVASSAGRGSTVARSASRGGTVAGASARGTCVVEVRVDARVGSVAYARAVGAVLAFPGGLVRLGASVTGSTGWVCTCSRTKSRADSRSGSCAGSRVAPVVVVRVDTRVSCVGYAGTVGTMLAFAGRLGASVAGSASRVGT